MALALRLPLFIVIVALGTSLPQLQPTALAAGLDAKDKATLKEATRLYKQGQYEEAAKLLTELAVDHAEMTNLQRNLGACYYYMRRPEPALVEPARLPGSQEGRHHRRRQARGGTLDRRDGKAACAECCRACRSTAKRRKPSRATA
jgi:thioredoxin-like negative regulator of GroEL